MPEMLTIAQAAAKLKSTYPDTTISEKTLRKWQAEKRFHYVMAGRRILISWNSLVSFLSGDKKEGA